MRERFVLVTAALLVMAADPPPAPAPAPALVQTMATGVLGRQVHDADGREIGRIVDVVVDPAGQPRAIVVDVGGFNGCGHPAHRRHLVLRPRATAGRGAEMGRR